MHDCIEELVFSLDSLAKIEYLSCVVNNDIFAP